MTAGGAKWRGRVTGTLLLALAVLLVLLGLYRLSDMRSPEPARTLEMAETLLAREENPSSQAALEVFEEILTEARTREDPAREADALFGMGRAWQQLGEPRRARVFLDQALVLSRSLNDVELEVDLLNELAVLLRQLGFLDEARTRSQESLDTAKSNGYLRGQCRALNSLAVLARRSLSFGPASGYYNQALECWRELGDTTGEATVLHNLGIFLRQLDLLQESTDALSRAAAIHRQQGSTRYLGQTLTELGWSEHWGTEPEKALPFYEEALTAFRSIQDRRGEAVALDRRASTLLKLGRPEDTLETGHEALAFFRETGERQSEAASLCNLGEALVRQGEHAKALEYLALSQALYAELGEPSPEAHTWYHRSLAEASLGQLDEARKSVERAIGLMETLALEELGSVARASYLSTLQDYYGAYIDLLIESFHQSPGEGFEAQILEVGERRRARGLLIDLIISAEALEKREHRQLQRRDQDLNRRIRALEGNRLSNTDKRDELLSLQKQRALLLEAGQLETMALSQRPELPEPPPPLGSLEIQEEILDRDTVALVFTLGTERVFLNLVTEESLRGFELAPRKEIESMARRTLGSLTKSLHGRSEKTAKLRSQDLSHLLLEPASAFLDRPRLLIVSDGELQRLPFASLPILSGASSSESLIDRFEVVSSPSLSTLRALRRRGDQRRPASKALALFADPVFSEDDPRVRERMAESEDIETSRGHLSSGLEPLPNFERLLFSGHEAKAILRHVHPEQRLAFVGFAATREAVMSGDLSEYRILHFATHALHHPEHPELTGLMMSQIDDTGRRLDGFVFTRDITGLDLSADLVVLSACRTVDGKMYRGEGVFGLARGFLHAGASRVLVSHWQVDDEATAELMSRFYTHFLAEGMEPATALRAAQLSMRDESRWSSPYFWAGFSLLGD